MVWKTEHGKTALHLNSLLKFEKLQTKKSGIFNWCKQQKE